MSEPRVSVVVVSYQSRRYLDRCLRSLLAQDHPSFEVVLVDNGSSDGGPEFVEAEFPGVRVVRSAVNEHYTGGNNRGFAAARGELLAFVNVDTEVAPGWLRALVSALDSEPRAALATSRVCLLHDRGRLNTCGIQVHVSGLGFCRGLGEDAARFPRLEPVPAISGSAFLARRTVIEEIGLFDVAFVAYVEDVDLSLRAALAGHDIVYVPDSVVFHDYELRLPAEKIFLLERNRTLPLRKVLSPRTLALMTPALLLSDLMTFASAALKGRDHLAARSRARRWLRDNRGLVEAGHREVQATRRVSDREVLARLSAGIPPNQLGLPRPLAAIVAPLAWAAFAVAMLPARLFAR